MLKTTQCVPVALTPKLSPLEELWILARRKGWNQKQLSSALSKFVGAEIKPRTVASWMDNTRAPNRVTMAQVKKFIQSLS